MSDVTLILDAQATLAEGPCWHADEGILTWVDIEAGDVHRLDPTTGRDDARHVGRSVGFAQRHARGGLVLGLTHAVAWLRPDDEIETIAPLDEGNDDLRLNDGKPDPSGRLLAGSLVRSRTAGRAHLYQVAPDGSVTVLRAGCTVANGLGWSPDGRTLYHIDTPRLGVDAFDYDPEAGTATGERRLVTIEEGAGKPDGLAVDAEGGLWVCLYGGGAVRRYGPDGTLDRVLEVPARNVTCAAFGGPDLRDLFNTTVRGDGYEPERDGAHAGGIFHARPGPAGLPVAAFAG